MNNTQYTDKGAWIRGLIEDFIESSENTMENSANDRVFEEPIVGYARGDDPIFEEFKKDIGAFYLTPLEAFEKVYSGSGVRPDELTVISWVLPHIKQTKMDNRKREDLPFRALGQRKEVRNSRECEASETSDKDARRSRLQGHGSLCSIPLVGADVGKVRPLLDLV